MSEFDDNKSPQKLDLSSLPKLSQILHKHNLSPKKSLGQHFLLNKSICSRIAESSGDLSETTVIEVGPGPGGLTRALLEMGAKQVIAIEKDKRCIAALNELALISNGRLIVKEGNALDFNFVQNIPYPKHIISNLPYNISTQLLVKWLDQSNEFSQMVLMFQKEVALRIVAKPNTSAYGRLSIYAQWLCKCEIVFDLKPNAFSPPPKVNSTIIRLTPYTEPLFKAPKEVLLRIIAAGFGQRRKKLRSSLKNAINDPEIILKNTGISSDRRAETLTLEEWCSLARECADTNLKIKRQ
ncbi:MAG: 16S rRNA (adenine(1518)-N(6)/adenine(1519)-N(6))-dimethyltransferase [Alphaproteobacteria bacterium]|nr:16S rRNA (adenine(1518)-N(6)/adenine(1519)-N(6))-dimethyltransferase [Alphaproteobacteria bacterium]|tara:strand:+ start:1955 stop:2842 length:888 start_codon:yes stop_codon:yes gene_type:complete